MHRLLIENYTYIYINLLTAYIDLKWHDLNESSIPFQGTKYTTTYAVISLDYELQI